MMPQFNYYLKNINATEPSLIYLQSKYNCYERLMLTTGEHILPTHWDFESKRAIIKYNKAEYQSINDWLDKIEMAAKDYFRNSRFQGTIPKASEIKAHLEQKFNLNPKPIILVKEPVKVTLMNFIETFIAKEVNNKSKGTIQVYVTAQKQLEKFLKNQGKKDIHFEEINADFYNDFIHYLNGLNFAKNTVGKAIKVLKTFLNNATDVGLNPNQFHKTKLFKKPVEDVDKAYINDDEILRIYNLDLSGEGSIEITRDLFIISCYTGFRFSDFTTLQKEHITDKYIIKKTIKTKAKVVVPIHPIVRKIFEKYQYEIPKSLTNAHANQQLKIIAEKAKITDDFELIKTIGGVSVKKIYKKFELISTHTGRRSFATNSYLAGVPTISIMFFTGHSTESSFMRYICIDELRNAEHLQNHDFFNKQNFEITG